MSRPALRDGDAASDVRVVVRGDTVTITGLTTLYAKALVADVAGFHRYGGATGRRVARSCRFWLQAHGAAPRRGLP